MVHTVKTKVSVSAQNRTQNFMFERIVWFVVVPAVGTPTHKAWAVVVVAVTAVVIGLLYCSGVVTSYGTSSSTLRRRRWGP